jgi:hypothetical protein
MGAQGRNVQLNVRVLGSILKLLNQPTPIIISLTIWHLMSIMIQINTFIVNGLCNQLNQRKLHKHSFELS